MFGARVGADDTLFWGVEVIMDSTFAGTVGVGVMVSNFVDAEGIVGLLVDVADETFALGCGVVAGGVWFPKSKRVNFLVSLVINFSNI